MCFLKNVTRLASFLFSSANKGLAASKLFAAALFGLVSGVGFAQVDPVPGSFDTTFASTGKITNFAVGAGRDRAWALTLQPDGKVIVVGECAVASVFDFCLTRFNANGLPDNTFNGNGKLLLPVGGANDYAFGVAVQSDGKIVAVGSCDGQSDDFCVVRLNSDGSLDLAFDGPLGNGDGKFLLPITTFSDIAYAVALQPDGKIAIGGRCNDDFCVVRLNGDGTYDNTFGASNGRAIFAVGASTDTIYALALEPDGKIVVAGDCFDGANNQVCVARLTSAGVLDSAFDGPSGNSDGKFVLTIGTTGSFYSVRVQPDGRIVLGGFCVDSTTTEYEFCLARLNRNGSYDTTFVGPSGTGNGRFLYSIAPRGDYINALALQGDGKILAVGECDGSPTGNGLYDFCFARFHSDGSLDATFQGPPPSTGNGRFVTSLVSGRDSPYATAIQRDGKIVVAGFCNNGTDDDFCLARLHGGPAAAKHCNFDIDGDGLTSATTDGLIAVRVMLGLRTATVLTGIGFPPSATRTTWPDIRDYLVSQCGLSVY
jgi:uncharacterized delta-60 repeat protein